MQRPTRRGPYAVAWLCSRVFVCVLRADDLGDYYQELPGKSACVECPANSRRYRGAEEPKSDTIHACKCKDGTWQPCPPSADCIAFRAEATTLHQHASGTASLCLSFAQVSGHPGLTNRCFKNIAACRAQRVGGAMAKGRCREHLKVTGRQSRTSRAICRMMPSTTALLSHASRSMIRTCARQPRKSRRRASSDTPVWLGELLFPTQTTYTGCAAINKHLALMCLDLASETRWLSATRRQCRVQLGLRGELV